MKTLVIEESKWLHGDSVSSCLLDTNGRMCCLGFLGASMGLTPEQMLRVGTPAYVGHGSWHPALVTYEDYNTSFCMDIVSINDAPDFLESDFSYKKARLTEMFATMDIKLEFIP